MWETATIGDLALMGKAKPDLGDVYWTTPKTVQGRDHGNRPATPVEVRPRVVLNVTRTTQEPSPSWKHVVSPPSAACGLDKAGWWTERKQRPIPTHWYGSADHCRYAGRLPSEEAAEVAQMWALIKMLGRENL